MSVCLSVCFVSDHSCTTGYEAAYEQYQQLQCYKCMKNNVAILLKRLLLGDTVLRQAKKPICIISTDLPRPGLARSVYRGQIKLLRGYVSKSSAALNPLKITQLYSLRSKSVLYRLQTALRDPAHQLPVRMRTRIIHSYQPSRFLLEYPAKTQLIPLSWICTSNSHILGCAIARPAQPTYRHCN